MDAIGSQALGIRSIAVGTDTTATGTNTVAIGTDALAESVAAIAIGAGAQASASNSVSVGAGSLNDRANSVSVGQPGNERQITNIAPGTAGTDAVNVNQLNAVLGGSQSDFKGDRDELRRGIAGAVSLATLTPSAAGKTVVNVGWGFYRGENAVGATVNHQLKVWEDKAVVSGTVLMLNAGVGYGINDDGPVVRAGAAFEF